MRELAAMADARRRERWQHTAWLAAVVWAGTRGGVPEPAAFDPYTQRAKQSGVPLTPGRLRKLFDRSKMPVVKLKASKHKAS